MNKITAQIAVEAIIALPHAFSRGDAEIVLADAERLEVDALYLDMLREIIPSLSDF